MLNDDIMVSQETAILRKAAFWRGDKTLPDSLRASGANVTASCCYGKNTDGVKG